MDWQDHTNQVREAVITLLKQDSSVAAVVGDRVYDKVVEPGKLRFPFIRYGLPNVGPWRASRLKGSDQDVPIHVFSKEPGMAPCVTLVGLVVAALESGVLDLGPSIDTMQIVAESVRYYQEPPNVTHGVIRYRYITVQVT